MKHFFHGVDLAIDENNESLISELKAFQKNHLSNQFLMKDYLYLKISHPEPFDILYFSPSIFTIYNLDDNSYRIGFDLVYNRFEDLELIIRQNYFPPASGTEFGEKATRSKTEFYIKIYF
ncbi:hypothetical protein K8T06_06195 [bacterium]|nr:hypothetical protein [bacterium]